MLILLVVLVVLSLLAVAALVWLKLEVGVYAQKEGADDQIDLFIAIPPLWRKEISVPVVEIVEKQGLLATRVLGEMRGSPDKVWIQTFRQQRQRAKRLWTLVRKVRTAGYKGIIPKSSEAKSRKGLGMRFVAIGISMAPHLHVRVKNLEFHSQVGLGDAAFTGMGIGLLWSLVGSGFAVVERLFPKLGFAQEPILEIEPVFDRWYFRGRFRCIVSLRLGEIIFEGTRSFFDWR